MKTILKYTGFTSEEYDKEVFNIFLMCCGEIAKDTQHLQLLLINKPMNKWFLTEVTKLNKDFLKTIHPYKTIEPKAIAKNYKSFLRRISNHYPSALTKKVKPQNKQPYLSICN